MSWLSKALEKSKKKGTGIYSWGESDLAKYGDAIVPGLGSGLDSALDALGATAGNGKSNVPAPKFLGSQDVQNQQSMMILGGLVIAYFLFNK